MSDNYLPDIKKQYPSVDIALSRRARRLRRSVMKASGMGLEDALAVQARLLDALFRELMIENAAMDDSGDERFGLALALRAQKQFKNTVQALDLMKSRYDFFDKK